jgi:ribonuclease HII
MDCLALTAGVDEVGRGPLAGPVVAAAVILDGRYNISGLADSKTLRPARREELALEIQRHARAWAIAQAEVEEIDEINILQASLLAMQRAVAALPQAPRLALVDGRHAPMLDCAVRTIVGGDGSVGAISAASIIAKVNRDALMGDMDKLYPGYGFAKHKGYGTKQHLSALAKLGPCPIHRRTFSPVKSLELDQRTGEYRVDPNSKQKAPSI